MTPRRLVAAVLLLALAVGVGGCGVSATSRPVDEGDAAAAVASGTDVVKTPHPPNDANSADELIRYFLQAASGGYADANDKVKDFLTPDARDRWRDPVDLDRPALTVVRIVGGPQSSGADVDGRTRVTLEYEIVGTMNDQGRIDDLLAPRLERDLTFWVVPQGEGDFYLRIDEIVGWPPGGLLLSDDALGEFYRIQPIYFWDAGYQLLVPDIRYLPLTINTDQRANQILRWLFAGASPWLGGLQRLPSDMSPGNVVTDGDEMLVNLSGEAAGAESPEALARLMYQLQWSLSPPGGGTPRIQLRLDERPLEVPVGEADFRRYNHAWTYDDADPDLYDITPEGQVAVVRGTDEPGLLAAEENAGVVYAAIDEGGTVAALVRSEPSGLRRLQILRDGQADPVDTQLSGFILGRPAFVPETDVVLVPAGGRLVAVSTVDGAANDATHALTGVTVAAVSPDGRRLAVVAGGEVYVTSLVVGGQVTVGSTQRQLLAGQLTARAVTWLSESTLLVGGTSGSGQAPALWRVSADGVLAEDLSRSGNLSGIGQVDDLVCYPSWPPEATPDVLAVTPPGVYTFISRIGGQQNLNAPFYGS